MERIGQCGIHDGSYCIQEQPWHTGEVYACILLGTDRCRKNTGCKAYRDSIIDGLNATPQGGHLSQERQ